MWSGRSRGLDWCRRCGASVSLGSVGGGGGAATRGCVRHVKRRRTKQRQEASCGKVAGPYEDTLEACKRRGVIVISL
jgi:hypothetical protein